MRKKLIMSLLMAIILAFVAIFVPVKSVRAEGNTCMIVETGVEYDTFMNAKKAAKSGETIKLLQDITIGSYSINKNLIIDFDDYTLTCTGSYFMSFSIGEANYTLTFKASRNGGFSGSNLVNIQEIDSNTKVTIESGTYDKFAIRDSVHSKNLNDDGFVTEMAGIIVVNSGTFYLSSSEGRTNLISLLPADTFRKSENLPSGTNRYVLDVKPYSYVTGEDTKASAKISYTEGYSCYRRVTSLSSSDAGKKYLIAYVNKSEDAIYIMKNYANASYHLMYPDKHNNVNKTNDGIWYINSNSEFIGAPDEDFFVTLGWAANGYTLSVKAGATNKYLFYDKSNQFEPLADSYTENANYIYKFGFNDPEDYLYPLSSSTNIVYTPKGTYKDFFRIAGTGITSETGLGDADNVRAHLFEKVDIDPVVSDASLRFGQTITKDMYDFLSGCGTTVTFGVVAKLTSALGGDELTYANAQIKKAITPVRVSAAGATEEDLEGNFYQFALVLSGITSSNYDTSVTARCYVCIDGDYYYFNESVYSLKTLADAYYNAVDTSAYTDHLPVLKYLKDYGD